MSKSHPIPLKGREYDTLTGWRRVLAYVQRPGVRKYDKRAYNKRVRRWKEPEWPVSPPPAPTIDPPRRGSPKTSCT